MASPETKLFPLVMADAALFCVEGDRLRVLLVRRAVDPERGRWALPGGILKPELDGSLEDTARRILREKTGVEVPYLEQVATFSGPNRDPRGWSVSVLFYALVARERVPAVAGRKTEAVEWADAVETGRRLAFDHASHLAAALRRLRERVGGDRARERGSAQEGASGDRRIRTSLPLHLLPERFTLTQLQRTVEAILDERLDKGAFRRRLKDVEARALVELPGEFVRGAQRPAQLYRAAEDIEFR